MDVKTLTELRRFAAEKMVKASVFSTPRMFYDLYCLEPGQAQKVHTHDDQDKVYVVLEGRGVLEVEGESVELGEGKAAFVPAGADHRFSGYEGLSVLVVFSRPHAPTSR